jgi:hypothetical protein
MKLTEHARLRCHHRAIPPMIVDLLLQFGACERAGAGVEKRYFDKAARRRLEAYAGPVSKMLNEHLDVYIVVAADNTVITAAHRLDRIQRH